MNVVWRITIGVDGARLVSAEIVDRKLDEKIH